MSSQSILSPTQIEIDQLQAERDRLQKQVDELSEILADQNIEIIEIQKNRARAEELYARLLNQVQTALDETSGLLEAAQSILSSRDLLSICQNLNQSFHRLVQADHTSFYLFDHASQKVIHGVFDGLNSEQLSYAELMTGISGIVVKNHKPIISLNPFDGIEPEATRQTRIDFGAGPVLVVPLIARDEVIGTFTAVNQKNKRDFNQHDVDLLMSLATQAAVAIDNLSLMQETTALSSRLKAIFEGAAIGLMVLNPEGAVTESNPALRKMLHYAEEELTGLTLQQLIHAEELQTCNEAIQQLHANQDGHRLLETRLMRREGSWMWGNLTLYMLANPEDDQQLLIGMLEDITSRRWAEEKLQYLSYHDPLTGLFNRTYFQQEMTRLEKIACYPISILAMDVDDLKKVNDKFGHPDGDELIRLAARALKDSFRSNDVVARMGGDEFMVLLPKCDETQVKVILERVRSNIEHVNQDHPLHAVSLSLGAATENNSGSLADLLRLADSRMYEEKRKKKAAQQNG